MSETPEVSGNSDIGADTKPSDPTQTLTPVQTSTKPLVSNPSSSLIRMHMLRPWQRQNPITRGFAVWHCCLLARRSHCGSSIVQYAIWWWIVLQTNSGMGMLLATLFGVVPQSIVSIFRRLLGRPAQSQTAHYAAGHGDCPSHRRAIAELRDGVGQSHSDLCGAVHSLGWRRHPDASGPVVHSRRMRPPANCYVSIQYMA